jgi:hypothetical protein
VTAEGRYHIGDVVTITISAEALAAIAATLPDGRVGELFLDGGRVDALSEMARERAIVVSLALQCGCSIETLRHALSGRGEGPIAAALALSDGAPSSAGDIHRTK